MKRTDDRTILQPSLESGSEVSTALHEKTVKQPGVWPVQGQKPELRVIKLLSYSDLGDRIGYEIVAVVQCSTKYPAMRKPRPESPVDFAGPSRTGCQRSQPCRRPVGLLLLVVVLGFRVFCVSNWGVIGVLLDP